MYSPEIVRHASQNSSNLFIYLKNDIVWLQIKLFQAYFFLYCCLHALLFQVQNNASSNEKNSCASKSNLKQKSLNVIKINFPISWKISYLLEQNGFRYFFSVLCQWIAICFFILALSKILRTALLIQEKKSDHI